MVLGVLLVVAAAGAAVAAWYPRAAPVAEPGWLTVYKTPWCGCCTDWIDHLRAEGLPLVVIEKDDLRSTRRDLGVPEDLASCHTAEVDGYAIEGHVPAREIYRLLAERPAVQGLAVPGMPIGSPGMEVDGYENDPYDVVSFGPDGRRVFASYRP
ncbi:MAG: DUF411 domain-containing protein [Pseudomonadales bacterium]